MSINRFINTVFLGIDTEISECLIALENQPFTDLGQVGKLQGKIQGLRAARSVIEQAIAEPEDNM